MHSFNTAVALVATSLLLGARAQYYIDPNSVPVSTRTTWCQSQINECPLLCLQLPGESSTTTANDCSADNLTFDCVCGNGLSPNASEYSQTLPYFICTEYGNQCVAACNGNTACQSACRDDHPCGAQNPTRINTTSSSSSMSATATLGAGASSGTAGVIYTGIGGAVATPTASSSSSAKKSGSQAALDVGRSYGLAVVFAGLFASFAWVL